MAFAANMIASLKLNNRRKTIHTPFSKAKKEYKKSAAVTSKKLTQLEKDLLLKKLKRIREEENKHRIYKIGITIVLTVIVISGIVFIIKFTFF